MWLYELRRADNHVIDEHRGFESEQEARSSGERAKYWYESLYAKHELVLTVKPEQPNVRVPHPKHR